MKKWIRRIGFLLLLFLAFVGLGKLVGGPVNPFERALGILEIDGTMWVSDEWVKQIEEFRKSKRIKGVVVRINSPGGTVAASQEIYSSLKRLSKTKPVVASMGSVAASGGFYVALGADKILADPGTITGSIGVRMEHVNLGDLLKLAKIQYETIKSGQLKDLGSISRPLTPEERTLLEELMVEVHQQFKEAIVESRQLKKEEIEKFADGRVFTGAKAKALGLVDELGDFAQAIQVAAKLAGISGEPELVYPRMPTVWWLRTLFGQAKSLFTGQLALYLYP